MQLAKSNNQKRLTDSNMLSSSGRQKLTNLLNDHSPTSVQFPHSARSAKYLPFFEVSPVKSSLKTKMLNRYRAYMNSNFTKVPRDSKLNTDLEKEVLSLTEELRQLKLKNQQLKEQAGFTQALEEELKRVQRENAVLKPTKRKSKEDILDGLMAQLKDQLTKINKSNA